MKGRNWAYKKKNFYVRNIRRRNGHIIKISEDPWKVHSLQYFLRCKKIPLLKEKKITIC